MSGICNKSIISGADTNNSGNLTCYNVETDRHEGALFNLKVHHSDERGNPITDSLPSGGTKSHSETCTGKVMGSQSQYWSSLLIVCMCGMYMSCV